MKPGWMLTIDCSGAGHSYLVICDSISQILDKPGQGFGIVNIAQELEEYLLFREWLEPRNNPFKLPERGVSKMIFNRTSTDLRSSTLLPLSA